MRTDVTERASPRTASRQGIQLCKHIEESPAWAINYGNEFWRHPNASGSGNAPIAPVQVNGSAGLPGSIDLGDVIGRVVHTFSTNVIDPTPHVDARNYSARFGGSGLELTARVANRGKDEEFAATTFRTLSIRRGSHLAYTSSEAGLETSVLGNTCQTLLEASSGLVEHYEARTSDVSVTWVMPRLPAGIGPLRVEAELDGLTFVDETSAGLRFADASNHYFWRVGRVTAVDSAGRKWEVPATAKGSRLSIESPETVLANARYPLAIDPTVGPEMPIGDPVVSPKARDQYNPVVAGSSNVFLVVWDDGQIASTLPGQIYATRVNSAGEVLDPNGIFLSSDKGLAAVAGGGEDFLVVWKTASEDENPQSTTSLRGARVGLNGSVLATYPALGNDVVKDGAPPAITARGSNYLVAWTQQFYGPPLCPDCPRTPTVQLIQARLVLGSGATPTFPVGDSSGGQAQPSAASDGSQYLVVYQQGGGIRGTRIDSAGSVIESSSFAISASPGANTSPRVASAAGDFLVVWEDTRNASYDIYGARVSGAGGVLDPDGIPIATNATAEGSPCIASSGTNYLVAWVAYDGSTALKGAVLDADGNWATNVLTISPSASSRDPQSPPAVAWNGETYFAAWIQDADWKDVFGFVISPGGDVADGRRLISTSTSNNRHAPAVAFNEQVYLVVWADSRNAATGDFDIYGARLGGDGSVLDPNGIAISTAGGRQYSPALAASGEDFFVAWEDGRNAYPQTKDIYGAIVTRSGVVANPAGIPICAANDYQTSPAVASAGADFLVAWEDWRNPFPINNDIYATRVSKAGTVLNPNGFVVCSVNDSQRFPSVASCQGDYLVVWADGRNSTAFGSTTDIYGTRVTGGGTVLDGTGFPISLATASQLRPRVAAATTNYLVVWEDERIAPGPQGGLLGPLDVFGTIVETNGSVTFPGGLTICTATNSQSQLAVAADGKEFLVAWTDGRNGPASSNDVYAVRVSTAGLVLDGSGFVVDAGANDQGLPTVVYGVGQFLVVSESLAPGRSLSGHFVTGGQLPLFIRPPTLTSNAVVISWLSQTGQIYRVQHKEDTAATWLDLSGDITGTGGVVSKSDTTLNGAPKRFYRLVRLP